MKHRIKIRIRRDGSSRLPWTVVVTSPYMRDVLPCENYDVALMVARTYLDWAS